MENSGKENKLVKEEEPSNKPQLRINHTDSDIRTGPKDRRKVHNYVADDRRSRIADRRKKLDDGQNMHISLH